MAWSDVAMILFSCVAANHLGLVHAFEALAKRELPVVNCPRCLSFWCVLAWMVFSSNNITLSVATSFLCSALAPWVELMMGFTDKKFNELYDKIYTTGEDAGITDAGLEESAGGTVPEL